MPRSLLLQPINALVVFLGLRDFLSRCTFRFSGNRRKMIQDRRPICWLFCFRFDLLFVPALWIYGVGYGV